MFDHEFKAVHHWRIGPIRNRWGWVFAVAEIGDSWFLRWVSPDGFRGGGIYSDYDDVCAAIEAINPHSRWGS